MNDTDSFRLLASTGAFSGLKPVTNDITNAILSGLNTFLISQAYQANGVIITRLFNTSVRALQTNGTKLNFDTSCDQDYDQYGVCNTYWYDESEGTTYALTTSSDNWRDTSYNKDMQTWFSNFTTPQLLFQGAAQCAPGSSPSVFSSTCLSSMKVCTWQLTPQPSKEHRYDLFSDCNRTDFPMAEGSCGSNGEQSGDTSDVDWQEAPGSYLGWGILNNQAYNSINPHYCK
jgi:hypothetical protein